MAKKRTPTRTKKASGKRHARAGRKILLILLVLLVLFLILVFLLPQQTPTATTADTARWIEGLEIPAPVPGEQQVTHTGYTLSYNETYEQPSWVAYLLTREKVNGGLERADNFRADPAITTGSATPADYRGSGYDRGHLCPAADQKWSAAAMDDSFYMSNMSPQVPAFNRGIWGSLEAMVRTFANDYGAVYVATGPVLSDGPYRTIGSDQVAVPKEYYKAVLYYDGKDDARSIGFLLPNAECKGRVQDYVVTIDELETKTGLDFFPALDDAIEDRTEAVYDLGQWHFTEFTPGAEANVVVADPEKDRKRETIRAVIVLGIGELQKQVRTWLRTL